MVVNKVETTAVVITEEERYYEGGVFELFFAKRRG